MTAEYVSSGSFGSIVRSKFLLNNIYIGRRRNFLSKPTPTHGPVHKYYFNYSYLRSHFSRLPQSVAKKKYCLSQKASYDSKIIDPVNK